MKTLVTVLTLTTLIAGVATANAQPQGSGESAGYALSQKMATPSSRPAFASAQVPARHTTAGGSGYDFQLQGR